VVDWRSLAGEPRTLDRHREGFRLNRVTLARLTAKLAWFACATICALGDACSSSSPSSRDAEVHFVPTFPLRLQGHWSDDYLHNDPWRLAQIDREALSSLFPDSDGWKVWGFVVGAPASPTTSLFDLVAEEVRDRPIEILRAHVVEPTAPYGVIIASHVVAGDEKNQSVRGQIAVAIVKESRLEVVCRASLSGTCLPSSHACRGEWMDPQFGRTFVPPLNINHRDGRLGEVSWNGHGSATTFQVRECQRLHHTFDIQYEAIPDLETNQRTEGPSSSWPEPVWQFLIEVADAH
jgi:hypothetical protein